MKVLHFSAMATHTGAGNAAARIHHSLRLSGVESRLCVTDLAAEGEGVFIPQRSKVRAAFDRIQKSFEDRALRRIKSEFDYVLSTGLGGASMSRITMQERPDVVQLHWIGGRSFRLSTLTGIKTPLVWRLADMWPFLGVEHFSDNPADYAVDYEPASGLTGPKVGLSRRIASRKQRIYSKLGRLVLTAPSRWLAGEVRRSSLLHDREIRVIPTSCDTEGFKPRSRAACREAIGLPADAFLVLIGATCVRNRIKGGDLFVDALGLALQSDQFKESKPTAVLFGNGADEIGKQLRCPHVDLGVVKDRRLMAMVYASCDVFVAPSRMENLANTVLESLACGTPVVAFSIGGMPDMIEHRRNGYLAQPCDPRDLAEGMRWAADEGRSPSVAAHARQTIMQKFTVEQECAGYLSLYHELLDDSRRCSDSAM